MKIYIALLLILVIENEGRRHTYRQKRDLNGNLLKLAKTTIKTGLSFGGETLKELKNVSKEKSLYNDYLTSAFLDLIFYPTINILQKTIKQNNDKLNLINSENIAELALMKSDSKSYNIALITLAACIPSCILILIFLIATYTRKFKGIKSNLGDIDLKVEAFLEEKDSA